MSVSQYFDPWMLSWVILPVFIFAARVADVSLNTVRIIYVSKGYKLIASTLGFFEVIIWLLAMGVIMQNLSNPLCFVAYGFGFAAGNWLGIVLDNKLSVGVQLIRIITRRDASKLVKEMREQGWGVTTTRAEGSTGDVKLIFTVLGRKDINRAIATIKQFNPRAFFSIEDIRAVSEGVFPRKAPHFSNKMESIMKFSRKGK